MPLCPACQENHTRRVGGSCPGCGTPLQLYKGYFFRESLGSPTLAILHHFEERVSKALSFGRPNPIKYLVPRKGARYKRELVAAERMLFLADGDFDLVITALNVLFDDIKFNWKTRDTLMYIEKDFVTAMAIARANLSASRERERKASAAFIRAMQREDIFS